MTIQELRDRKESLCEELAGIIGKFEEETTVRVSEKISYKRGYAEDVYHGSPLIELDFEFDYPIEPEDADGEEVPNAKAANAS